MKLHEYQAKKIFVQYGLIVPIGYSCNSPYEAEVSALKIGVGPWVVKCQIHGGGRGKSGGIKIVNSKEDVRAFAEQWLGKYLVTYQTNSFGQLVNQILVEAAIEVVKELYLSVVIDRSTCRVIFIASDKGGVDIEKVAETTPNLIYTVHLDLFIGPQPYQGRELACKLGLYGKQIDQFSEIFVRLVTLFLECDLSLAEINPLAINNNRDLVCLDAKLHVDDNALFRQSKLKKMRDLTQENPREAHAMKSKLNYVELDGNIGCMVNGAGLAMATMDIIKFYGGRPANFLDVGGDSTKERISEAFKIILFDDKVKAILINIFGGIVRCDLIADGIIEAITEVDIRIPVVVRLEGNLAALGIKNLIKSELNIIAAKNLTDAVKQVVALVEKNYVYFDR